MDRKRPNSGSGKALAPIFTKKAAPLMSHPKNSKQVNNKQGRVNSQSYPNQGNSSRGRPSKTQNYQQSMQKAPQSGQGRHFPRTNSFSNEPPGRSAALRPPGRQPPPETWGPQASSFSNQSGSYMMSPTPAGPGGDYIPYMDSYRPPDNYQANYQNFQRQPAPYQYDAPPMYQDPRQYPHQYGGGGDAYFQHQQPYRPGPQSTGYSSQWNPTPNPQAPLPQLEESVIAAPSDKNESVTGSKEFEVKRKHQPDCSLRFLSSSIQGAKHWARYLHKLPIMFEIFGVLSSQVTAGSDGYSCSKGFMLKDNNDTTQCVFYQIDRGLPKMVRGRWYRCVGHLQKDKLNCVAIREASDTERKLHKTLISASDRAMREWVTSCKEM